MIMRRLMLCVLASIIVWSGGTVQAETAETSPHIESIEPTYMRLTDDTALDNDPVWSPDGTQIAFVSERDGNPEIYVMYADGSQQTRLTHTPETDYQPTWSPDGTQIAFTSERDGNPEVYVMEADGTDQTRLTHDPQRDYVPVWSPDSAQIAFISQRDRARGIGFERANALFSIKADGSQLTRLTPAGTYGPPAWSPDSTQIAFAKTFGSAWDIYVMNADGSNVTPLTAEPETEVDPVWSPDGTRILFRVIPFNERDEIFVMDVDGSNRTRLTTNMTEDYVPTWSPDGTRIAFASYSFQDGNTDLVVMDADGQHIQTIATEVWSDYSWSPDGMQMAFDANRNGNVDIYVVDVSP